MGLLVEGEVSLIYSSRYVPTVGLQLKGFWYSSPYGCLHESVRDWFSARFTREGLKTVMLNVLYLTEITIRTQGRLTGLFLVNRQ